MNEDVMISRDYKIICALILRNFFPCLNIMNIFQNKKQLYYRYISLEWINKFSEKELLEWSNSFSE